MIKAVLDIGTNTILMTILNQETGIILGDFSRIARLGEGLGSTGRIGPATIARMDSILNEYASIGNQLGVSQWLAVATSAMRDAKNSQDVVAHVLNQHSLAIQIISGDLEAELTYKGGLHGLQLDPTRPIGLIDIGGGSTEFILGTSVGIIAKKSLNIGTVRLSERFNLHAPNPSDFQLKQLNSHIREQLDLLPFKPEPTTQWTAVAGTPTSLSAAYNQLKTYQSDVVHRSILPLNWIEARVDEFSQIPPPEILKRYPVFGNRYDLMLAGSVILAAALRWAKTESVTVSDHGLRYGLLTMPPSV